MGSEDILAGPHNFKGLEVEVSLGFRSEFRLGLGLVSELGWLGLTQWVGYRITSLKGPTKIEL